MQKYSPEIIVRTLGHQTVELRQPIVVGVDCFNGRYEILWSEARGVGETFRDAFEEFSVQLGALFLALERNEGLDPELVPLRDRLRPYLRRRRKAAYRREA